MPINDLYWPYQKPETLTQLEQLVLANDQINLQTIGFFLFESIPQSPAPPDIIPFATTGGDGCCKAERLVFYREAPNIYKHFADDYRDVLLLSAKYLAQDGYRSAADIVHAEVTQRFG